MSDSVKHRCEAIVVRYAPDPSVGEMLNIGVVLLSPAHRYAEARFVDRWARITGAFPGTDRVHLRRVASAIEAACDAVSGEQLVLSPPSDAGQLFDRVVSPDDASLVRSAPLAGITADPARTLAELFARYVTAREPVHQRSRTDGEVWRSLEAPLKARGVLGRIEPRVIKSRHYELKFDGAWQNRGLHVAKSVSLDLVDPHEITTKAASWMGRIRSLEPEKQKTAVHLLVGLPPERAEPGVRDAAAHGVAILEEQLEADVVLEEQAEAFAERIAHDLATPHDE